jgi:hypothetical protein
MQKMSKNTQQRGFIGPLLPNKSRSTSSASAQSGNRQKFANQSRQTSVGINNQQKTKTTTPKNQNGRFQHREFIGNLSLNGGGFNIINRYRLNPGSVATFPWLSRIATNYENYKFHKLKFHFISRLATNQNSAFIMSPDYDAADKAPLTEREFSANVDTVENTGWSNLSITLNPSRMNRLYKAHTCMSDGRFATTTQDQKTIDVGFLNVAYDSLLNTSLGKLWVEYDVEFHEPQYSTESPAYGGQGSNKVGDLNPGVNALFQTNNLETNFAEEVPVLKVLPANQFPGPNLFEFTRDWSGFVTKRLEGTGISGVGGLTLNGLANGVNTVTPMFNTGATASTNQEWIDAKMGDLLGNTPITASTLSRLIMNLGGSSVT